MKKLFFTGLLLICLISYGQTTKLKEYKASNGITYKVGDKIKMNQGSAGNGNFIYLTMGGILMTANAVANQIPATYAGANVLVKKIKHYKRKTLGEKTIFTVGGGNITNYTLDIEGAIATCEVTPCNKNTTHKQLDIYDKLKKIKALFDEGILTEKEYEKEKEKLLEKNQ